VKYYYQVEGLKRNNLGDIIQGIAAKQFLPADSIAADREKLALIPNEPSLLIANGWYQHEFENFPPPPKIIPFYISVHIAKSDFIKIKSVRAHFLLNAPIGCRDYKTLWLMRGFGIPAYFSGCLTLTFKPRYFYTIKSNEVIWVDNMDHPIPLNIELKLNELLPAGFKKISHDPLSRFQGFNTYVKENTKLIDSLFEEYKKANLVLTTKIHCALPCIGMGIPVILIHPNPNDPRLTVLNNLIKVISYDELMDLKELPVARNKKSKTLKLKNKLIYLTELAVKQNTNPFMDKRNQKLNIQFKYYRMVSFFTSKIIKLIFKIGFLNNKINKVFGKDYLIG